MKKKSRKDSFNNKIMDVIEEEYGVDFNTNDKKNEEIRKILLNIHDKILDDYYK